MICPNCNNVILDGSSFCGFCGKAMEPETPAVEETVAPAAPEVIEAPPAPEAIEIPAAPEAAAPAVEETVATPSAPVAEVTAPAAPPVPVAEAAVAAPVVPVAAPAAPVVPTAPVVPVVAPVMPVAPAPPSVPVAAHQDKHVGAWGYFFTDIVLCIPILGIIMFFVWALSKNANKHRKSYVRSKFIWIIVCLIVSIVASVLCVLYWTDVAAMVKSVLNFWGSWFTYWAGLM